MTPRERSEWLIRIFEDEMKSAIMSARKEWERELLSRVPILDGDAAQLFANIRRAAEAGRLAGVEIYLTPKQLMLLLDTIEAHQAAARRVR